MRRSSSRSCAGVELNLLCGEAVPQLTNQVEALFRAQERNVERRHALRIAYLQRCGEGLSRGNLRNHSRERFLNSSYSLDASVSLRALAASVTSVVGLSSLMAPAIAASLCAPPAANTRIGAARTVSSGTDMTRWFSG